MNEAIYNSSALLDDNTTRKQHFNGFDKRIGASSSMHTSITTTAKSGCTVTLLFSDHSSPEIRKDIASMLLTAFEKRRK